VKRKTRKPTHSKAGRGVSHPSAVTLSIWSFRTTTAIFETNNGTILGSLYPSDPQGGIGISCDQTSDEDWILLQKIHTTLARNTK